jgi:hypothetical protein
MQKEAMEWNRKHADNFQMDVAHLHSRERFSGRTHGRPNDPHGSVSKLRLLENSILFFVRTDC